MTAHERGTVLIVDDDASSAETLRSILAPEYNVLVAQDGFTAIRIAAESLPDLVLLDVRMPRIDGYVACKLLKSDPLTSNIPVIFVTAKDLTEDVARGFAAGAADYVTKPIAAPIVLARVRNHVELKRNRDLLESLSLQDPLTQLANRRRFDDLFAREWLRGARMASPLGVMLLDIDHFKEYNDLYGHGRGDECLRRVARALADVVRRPTDLMARYGGEEFVCLLPDTEIQGMRRLAERCREAIESLAIPHEASPTSEVVTISIGAVSRIPAEDDRAEDVLSEADLLLYQAKEDGRNRIRVDEVVAADEPVS